MWVEFTLESNYESCSTLIMGAFETPAHYPICCWLNQSEPVIGCGPSLLIYLRIWWNSYVVLYLNNSAGTSVPGKNTAAHEHRVFTPISGKSQTSCCLPCRSFLSGEEYCSSVNSIVRLIVQPTAGLAPTVSSKNGRKSLFSWKRPSSLGKKSSKLLSTIRSF